MNADNNKLNIFLDLMQIVEQGFIFKLKKRKPTITEKEIQKEVQNWYSSRPENQNMQSDCRIGDISRFTK